MHPDQQTVIMLGFVCWYALIEWGVIRFAEPVDEDDLATCLSTVTSCAIEHYGDDPEVLFHYGYILSIIAGLYFTSEDAGAWLQRATAMLAKAHHLKPDDPVYTMVYLADIGEIGDAYTQACKRSQQIVQQRYAGEGVFDTYFRGVLTRDT